MANPENTKLCDFTSTNNSNFICTPIAPPATAANFYEIKPALLGRSFLRTVGAIIDMREGTIKYQFPLKKGMENFPRKRKKLVFDSILRANYELDASSLDIT
jgi:hypothetical protein